MWLKYSDVEKVRRATEKTIKLSKKVQSHPGVLQTHENIKNLSQVWSKSWDFVNFLMIFYLI